ncbi:WD40 repeat domain-containing protein [Spirosoma validum]|uniref:Uncharacterized protein n=1 Tax=Spirosoma validum TaxID=2771355 RepID=A0A927GGX4_9BACT|nr:hypothetical protein [Spirosoma validum]MBD2757148.1 hypothetical protein [Spirosoma validum]
MNKTLLLSLVDTMKARRSNAVIKSLFIRQKTLRYLPFVNLIGQLIMCLWLTVVRGNNAFAQSQWIMEANVKPANVDQRFANFGGVLSSNGQMLAVGAPENSTSRGQVKVYKRISGAWSQQGNTITGDAVMDYAGHAMALSADGKILAVGAYVNNSQRGQVKVYKLIEDAWIQQGNAITGNQEGSFVGNSVSLSSDGQTLAVGAHGSISARGQVAVYALKGGVWIPLGNTISGEAEYDYAGFRVALSANGQTLAMSAIGNTSERGQVKVYTLVGGVWIQIGTSFQGEATGDAAGWSIALSLDGQTLAFGTTNNNASHGKVKAYKIVSGVWTQQGSDIVGNQEREMVGSSVALSSDGQTLAVGAVGNNNYRGQLKVYKLVSRVWVQKGSDINGEFPLGQAGGSVSLSSDGQILAIGAQEYFPNSGSVKVYRFCDLPVSITPNSQTISAGTSLTLAADGGDNYSWSNSQNTPSIIVAPTTTTTYSVTSISGVCSTTANVTVTVLPTADLTSIVYARPAPIYGSSIFGVVVDVVELNSVASSGSFSVRVTKDQKVNLAFDAGLTSVNGRTVQNSVWNFDNSNFNYYILTTSENVAAGDKLSFGLTGQLSPGASSGIVTVSSTVLPATVVEARLNNTIDADKVEYFQQ